MRFLALAAVMLFVAAAMPVEAGSIDNPKESAPVRMHFHLEERRDFPITTSPPADEHEVARRGGFVTHSIECVPSVAPDVPPSMVRDSHHTYYGYGSAGAAMMEDGRPSGNTQIHMFRGMSYDVDLDPAMTPMLDWYMVTQVTNAQDSPIDPDVPIVVPQVVIEATIRQGDGVSVNHEALNEGPVVATGMTAPAGLAGPATDSPHVRYMGTTAAGDPLYGARFPLTYELPSLVARDGYNVRIDMYVREPLGVCTGPGHPESSTLMPDLVAPYVGPGAWPGLDWAVHEPIRIVHLAPSLAAEAWTISASAVSPWGSYNIAPPAPDPEKGSHLRIMGPSYPISLQPAEFSQRTHMHNYGADEPIDLTWVWPYAQDHARPGSYTAQLTVWDAQMAARATAEVEFVIGEQRAETCRLEGDDVACVMEHFRSGDVEAPGAGLALLVAIVACAAWSVRRR